MLLAKIMKTAAKVAANRSFKVKRIFLPFLHPQGFRLKFRQYGRSTEIHVSGKACQVRDEGCKAQIFVPRIEGWGEKVNDLGRRNLRN
ncbi:hypothetical protein [Thalassovita gelatinovora]|uniref:hypothetical protein n=1 Tax=Thalassovita gelatinovora TaxID=53501 RepID=UPI00130DD3E6|nr:hypothetical protein [Thalassovita gelatinovora]QIZ80108.1 hypothetical protein HFZ77_06280 [Thalassovita gelatinovora]